MGMVHEPIEQREPWGNSLTYGRVVREEDDSQSTPEEDEWLTYCEEELTPNREQYLSLLKDCRGAKEEDDSQTKKISRTDGTASGEGKAGFDPIPSRDGRKHKLTDGTASGEGEAGFDPIPSRDGRK